MRLPLYLKGALIGALAGLFAASIGLWHSTQGGRDAGIFSLIFSIPFGLLLYYGITSKIGSFIAVIFNFFIFGTLGGVCVHVIDNIRRKRGTSNIPH